jgi:hypothetical protein
MLDGITDQGRSTVHESRETARTFQEVPELLGPNWASRVPPRTLTEMHETGNTPRGGIPVSPHEAENNDLKPVGNYWWLNSYAPMRRKANKKFLGVLPAATAEWLAAPVDKLLHSGTFQPEKMAELRSRPGLAPKDRDPRHVFEYLHNSKVRNIEAVGICFKDRTGVKNRFQAIYIRSAKADPGLERKVSVYCPGRGGGIGYLSDVARKQALSNGQDVLLLSYRGYDTNMMEYSPSQESMVDDIDAAINFLILKKGYKPENINFTACSLGVDALLNALATRVQRLALVGAKESWGHLDLRCPFRDLKSIALERIRETIPALGRILQYPIWALVRKQPMNHHNALDFVYPYVKSMSYLANEEGPLGIGDDLIKPWHTTENYNRSKALIERSKGLEPDPRFADIEYLTDLDHQQVSTYIRGRVSPFHFFG